MKFQSIEIINWRQFAEIKVDFHENLTILTGANGSGKTTILNILGKHYNWNINFVSTPTNDLLSGTLRYLSGLLDDFPYPLIPFDSPPGMPPEHRNFYRSIGSIFYSNGQIGRLWVDSVVGSEYSVNIKDQLPLTGLHIASHRPIYSYKPVTSIPTQPFNRDQMYQQYYDSFLQRFLGNFHPNIKSPNQIMKESLLALAIFGEGNKYVLADTKASNVFEGFQDILSKTLPPKIGFRKLSVRIPEIVFETKSGDFSLDAVSGGVSSIIDMAWRIFMRSPEGGTFVCSIDEPENHLHPELQQSLLPNLVNAFPNVQFIITTHSPFMITAVYDSAVYVLDYNESNKVESQRLDSVNKSGTANEILRNVLGLPFTMPLWAEQKFESIVNKYAVSGVDEETVDELEAELKEAGLENFLLDTNK